MTTKRGYKRGYPVAVLVSLEDDTAILWRIFSHVVKHEKTLWKDGDREDSRSTYNFRESIINALRPTLKEGVRSVMLASSPGTGHAQEFVSHVREHHVWLVQGSNKATFSVTEGSAGTLSEVAALTRTPQFRAQISKITSEETGHLIDALEKQLNAPDQNTIVLYSLKEIEGQILKTLKPNNPKRGQLMLTSKHLSESREKNRIHRLLQVASNKGIKTRIVDAESAAGKRLAQLGGLVFFTQLE